MPKGRPKDQDMYGITLQPWGFEVSVTRERIRHRAQFGIAQWGGKEEALRQAQAWRDFIVRAVPPIERRARAEKLVRTNKSGIAGVTALLRSDGRVQGWRAHTHIAPGKRIETYFSVNRYGASAFDMAIFAREQQLKLMQGLTKPHPVEEQVRKSKSPPSLGNGRKKSSAEIIRRNNSSGVSGVHFKRGQGAHPGYWMAITYERDFGSVSKAFSIRTYGSDQAKELAIQERSRQVSEIAARRAGSAQERARLAKTSADRA